MPSVPSGFMAASRSAFSSTPSAPVAPGAAAAPSNATVCAVVPFPSTAATARRPPPEETTTDAYASAPARTGSV